MKKLSLKIYSLYRLQNLIGDEKIDINEIIKNIDRTSQLYAPFICYCVLSKKIVPNSSTVSFEIKKIQNKRIDKQNGLISYIRNFGNEELKDYIDMYERYLAEEKEIDKIKNECRGRMINLHKFKGISYYQICKNLEINPGNLYSFIHKMENNKLSVEKCIKYMNFYNIQEEESDSQGTDSYLNQMG